MSHDFDPQIAELTQRGATAALLLDAQTRLVGICVEQVLRQIDRFVRNETMSADRAIGLCYELAAYRGILARQRGEIDQGRAAMARQEQGS